MTERERDDHERGPEESGGVYIAGSMIGGAAATGADSEAEDSSRKEGGPTAADLPAPSSRLSSAPPGQTVVGGHFAGGAVATGARSKAADRSVRIDTAHREFAESLACVRRELAKRERTFEVEAVDRELAEAEQQIESTGTVGRSLLDRLVSLFSGGSTILQSVTDSAVALEALKNIASTTQLAAGELEPDE
ncbi:hypothetical protein CDO52_24795 [Nocardiopsis gilva YIM 90087]|uniref:Uncharacterized protein n=1 Tax=Nocardiopsis gilva YIM 90087 TaxID=1235441 RepID=A0A223SBN8_9ACTN|nr:hypothetical protein [Nocardiopsis gilva]ASU85591.1 hypothetical protein CDO52_24795 [Nocardiopsis gilva YIM 90087]